MKPSRENILAALAGLERSGLLPEDGPTSVFLSDGPIRRQLAVLCCGDEVRVRTSRLPFMRQQVFSRARLRCVDVSWGWS